MDYERRLLAASEVVLAGDSRGGGGALEPSDLGVAATLKPHQLEGVSWLLRRYELGVNVILGTISRPRASSSPHLFLSL